VPPNSDEVMATWTESSTSPGNVHAPKFKPVTLAPPEPTVKLSLTT